MSLTPTFLTPQSAKARGANSAAWVTTGMNLPAGALIVVLVGAVGNQSGPLPGSDIRCTVAGFTVTQRTASPSSSTWMYGSAVFTFVTTSATTGTTMSFDFWNGSLNQMNTWQLQVIAFTGYDTTTPIAGIVNGTSATGTGAGSVTLSATPTAADYVIGLLHGLCNTVGSITATQGAGFTEQWDDYDDDSGHIEVEYVTGVTSTTVAWAQLGTPSGVAAESHMIGFIVKALAGSGSTYNVSVAETGTAADSPTSIKTTAASVGEIGSSADVTNGSGGSGSVIAEAGTAADTTNLTGSYGVAITNTLTAADSPSAIKTAPAAIAESGSAADVVSLPPAYSFTEVYSAWSIDSVGAGWNVELGSPTFSCTAGDGILVYWCGVANADQGTCSDSVGGTIPRIAAAFNNWSSSATCYGGYAYLPNVAGGSHTVTPPTVLGGNDGGIRVYRLTSLGNAPTATGKQQQNSSSKTITVATTQNVAAGQVAFGGRSHENSVGSTDTLTPPAGWTRDGTDMVNGAAFIPTNVAHYITQGSDAGAPLSGTWTSQDNAITDTEAAIVVFTPTSSGNTYGSSVSESGTAADSPSAIEIAVASMAESGTAADSASASDVAVASVTESGTAADTASAGRATPTAVSENGTVADTIGAAAVDVASVVEVESASDVVYQGSTAVTKTLESYWLKSWETGATTPIAVLQSGSDPFTPIAGATILAFTAAYDSSRQVPVPGSSHGTFNIISDGTTSAVLHPGPITTHISAIPNAAASSTSITPAVINDGIGGDNGEIADWIVQFTNMPGVLNVRDVKVVHNTSSAKTWHVDSASTVQAGDLLVTMGTYENSSASVSGGLSNDAANGWLQIGTNNDASQFIPTQVSWKIATSAGVQTATFTTTDNAKTEDYAILVVLVPNAGTVSSATVSEGGTAADSNAAASSTSAALAENGSAADTSGGNSATAGVLVEVGVAADVTSEQAVASAAMNEVAAASDTAATAIATSATTSEALTSADTVATSALLFGAVAESSPASDSAAVASSASGVVVAEAASAADTTSNFSFNGQGVQETANAVDATNSTAAMFVGVAEAQGATDATGISAVTAVSAQEQLASADAPFANVVLPVLTTEAANAIDSTNLLAGTTLAMAEVLAAQESATMSAVFSPAVAEVGAATDTIIPTGAYLLTTQEAIQAVDAQSVPQAFFTTMQEMLAANDVVRLGSSQFGDIIYHFGMVEVTNRVVLRTGRSDKMVITFTQTARRIVP